MNIKEAKEEIIHTVKAYTAKDELGNYEIGITHQRPVLLIGPPGIGKTAIMEQVARECGIGLVAYTITHHTRQSAIGLPIIEHKDFNGKEYPVTEYTMSEIIGSVYDQMEKTGLKEGILFIDEINCVSETLAPTMLQFLQGKTFGNHRVPDGWIIVAAGNPPEYNKSVKEFDIVTLDRVKRIDVRENLPVWKEYAYKEAIHGSIISYLDVKKENFYTVETTVEGKRFVTARGWEDLSQMIKVYQKLNIPVTEGVIGQYLQHPGIAKEFAAYLDLYEKYASDYNPDDILRGRVLPGAVERMASAPFDEKLSVIGLLVSRLSDGARECFEKDSFVERLFAALKFVKSEPDLLEGLTMVLTNEKEKWEKNQNGKAMDKADARIAQHLMNKLEEYIKMVRNGGDFEAVKTDFNGEAAKRQEMITHWKSGFDNSFGFIEAAFGESQEMVVFITELNSSHYALWFIGENGCEKYYQYNQGLLLGERQRSIMSDIQGIEKELSFLN
ncbi:MAG: AAA family ATPase [Clostridia bacterium]|nr:MoxR family ATPase [Lachnospiraceae bacterium]NCB99263.1 AAA family ATPase [Clostridia bacterium]NCD01412.1 AAA family ATPase [Clostridia bacterium]